MTEVRQMEIQNDSSSTNVTPKWVSFNKCRLNMSQVWHLYHPIVIDSYVTISKYPNMLITRTEIYTLCLLRTTFDAVFEALFKCSYSPTRFLHNYMFYKCGHISGSESSPHGFWCKRWEISFVKRWATSHGPNTVKYKDQNQNKSDSGDRQLPWENSIRGVGEGGSFPRKEEGRDPHPHSSLFRRWNGKGKGTATRASCKEVSRGTFYIGSLGGW